MIKLNYTINSSCSLSVRTTSLIDFAFSICLGTLIPNFSWSTLATKNYYKKLELLRIRTILILKLHFFHVFSSFFNFVIFFKRNFINFGTSNTEILNTNCTVFLFISYWFLFKIFNQPRRCACLLNFNIFSSSIIMYYLKILIN